LLGIVFVVAQNYFSVLQPQVIREALDSVVNNLSRYQELEGEAAVALFDEIAHGLLIFGLMVVGLALLMGLFMYFTRQTIIVMSRLIEYDLRNEIFEHYEKLDFAFYKRNNTGDLMARISEDVNKVRMYLGPAVLYAINLVFLFLLVITSMIRVSPELTLYCLLPLPILSISIYYVSNLINKKSEQIQRQLSTLNSLSQEVYSGIRVVKSYVQEDSIGRFFGEESDQFKNRSMELARVDALFHPLMLLLIGLSTIITIYVGGLQVIKGNITPGNIAEFVIYINMLTWPVTAIGWIASIIQRASASQKRINEFLKEQPAISNPTTDIYPIEGAVRFDNVSFVYPDSGIKALQNVSFSLKKGEKLAIVGKTGSGKTTIADLLLRMYDVETGTISIDGKDIQKHNLSLLRDRIGYVPQDVFLFSNTVKNNIAFGAQVDGEKSVEEYAGYASIHNEILELEKGYETIVGERGVTLSGGQKQRISIARAFIKEPEIVLLDDCLSAVDTNTEKHILQYLKGALKDKTTIIITHRIYSFLKFDRIIVLEDGAITEQGTHDELLKTKGFYSSMYQKQMLEDLEFKS